MLPPIPILKESTGKLRVRGTTHSSLLQLLLPQDECALGYVFTNNNFGNEILKMASKLVRTIQLAPN